MTSSESGIGLDLATKLIEQGSPTWDDARQPWNLCFEHRPPIIAQPETPADVVATLELARERGLKVAAQAMGHGSGTLGLLEDSILIKTSRMKEIQVDAERRRLRAGAGVLWHEVASVAGPQGLAGLSGTAPDVGVAGYTLGGGIGWLSRKYGLCCNTVVAAEVVTADGRELRIDEENEPDLFWAIRGGGGNFAIVTALELELVPVKEVYGGVAFFPDADCRDYLGAYAEWVKTVPEETTSFARFIHLPDHPLVPPPLREVWLFGVEAVHLGTEGEGAELLRPLRELGPATVDTFGMMPVTDLATIHGDPPEPFPGTGHHTLLAEMPQGAIEALAVSCAEESGSPLVSVEIRHLGGALQRTPEQAGALATLPGEFLVFGLGAPTPGDREMHKAMDDYLLGMIGRLEPWSIDQTYMNFAEQPHACSSHYPAGAWERLCEVRERYDPDGLLVGNHKIGIR